MIEVVSVVIHHGGKVLVAKRKKEKLWEFPGGKVNEHESFEQAAVREIEEETGLIIGLNSKISETTCVAENGQNIHLTMFHGFLLFPERCDKFIISKEHSTMSWKTWSQVKQLSWMRADQSLMYFIEKDFQKFS